MPSMVIQSYEYDASRKQLLVVFRSGRRYMYQEVPTETFEAMKRAFSKGEFFNEHIRDHFTFVRMEE